MKTALWPFSSDSYKIFQLLLTDPRITERSLAREFNVTEKTIGNWLRYAFNNVIVRTPVFRRKSFINFREYIYFVRARDPDEFYESLINKNNGILFCSVQTGFSNLQIVSTGEINLKEEVVFSGTRSDYHVSIPPKRDFSESFRLMEEKLNSIGDLNPSPSPLIWRNEYYTKWNEDMEKIYLQLFNDMRKPFRQILRETGVDFQIFKKWLKDRDEFGQTIIMYFPDGVSAYQPTTYCIETEHDSLLIDLFSNLPVSCYFYRLDDRLLMKLYLPYTTKGKKVVRNILRALRKKELVQDYANSIDEYYYTPGKTPFVED